MPNDEGLRRCTCGRFVLLSNLVQIDSAESSELPYIDHVPDALLPECIANAGDERVEVAARLGYWRYLNHEYRERYRQHRDAEEASTQARWEAANPDQRTWVEKLLRRKPPQYRKPKDSPFTYPAFLPTEDQFQNMMHLSKILLKWHETGDRIHALELVDIYRQLGRFDEAESVILAIADDQSGVTSQLIARLIKEKQCAPMRYRM